MRNRALALAALFLFFTPLLFAAPAGKVEPIGALTDSAERGHLVGDVPALLLVAAALGVLTRRAETESSAKQAVIRRAA